MDNFVQALGNHRISKFCHRRGKSLVCTLNYRTVTSHRSKIECLFPVDLDFLVRFSHFISIVKQTTFTRTCIVRISGM